MRVLSVASEIYPLVKTGGLADVAGALPAALAAKGVAILGTDQLHEADGLEAAGPADDRVEVAEDLEALDREPGLGVVRVVHAHERAGFTGGAGGEVTPLQQEHVADAEGGQVERGAGADGAFTYDDDVGHPHRAWDCSNPWSA